MIYLCICRTIKCSNRRWCTVQTWRMIFKYFSKICRDISSFIETWQEQRTLYTKTNMYFWYLPQSFLEWEMFQTKVVDKINTHFMFNNIPPPPPQNRAVYEIMWENIVRAGQATDDNMTHAHCTRRTKAYKHTLITGVTDCFFPLRQWR